MPVVTNQLTRLSYFVANIATSMASFDHIRWWRSRTGQYGLYEPATGAVAGPAVLTSSKSGPHALNGKTLSLRINGASTVDILFSDADPVTTAQAATEIAGETALIVPSDVDGALRLTTTLAGTLASIEVLESDAAPFLGFAVGDAAVGTDADSALVALQREYLFDDQNGYPTFWYKAELLHSVTALTRGLSIPFQATALGISKDSTTTCYLRLTDMQGTPLPGRVVTFANPFQANVIVQGADPSIERWGVFRHYAQMVTDTSGYAEIRLLRGMQVDFVIDGTNFVRRVTIPDDQDGVDLLDPVLVVEDEFGIQEPNIDFAIRTS